MIRPILLILIYSGENTLVAAAGIIGVIIIVVVIVLVAVPVVLVSIVSARQTNALLAR
jgi:hypothetical protein